MKLVEYLEKSGNIFLQNLTSGRNVSGHNGPYHDPETEIRNLSHWLIIFGRLYELTGNEKYLSNVSQLAELICDEKYRPYGYTFHHRSSKNKDCSNGLIGQAWTFEALVKATEILKSEQYVNLAMDVYQMHDFDKTLGLWQVRDIDGRNLGIDWTFNHQLWFAAISNQVHSMLNIDNEEVKKFMEHLSDNLEILPNGLIFHPVKPSIDSKLKYWVKDSIKSTLTNLKIKSYNNRRSDLVYKSIGYQTFNLYAFAILKKYFPENEFWNSSEFDSLLVYVESDDYRSKIENNIYAYSYNSPGFEMPYILSVFSSDKIEKLREKYQYWVNKQFDKCFNEKDFGFTINNQDPLTLGSRIYELLRIDNQSLFKIELAKVRAGINE